MRDFQPVRIARNLLSAWSLQSSSLWRIDNPARGHCGVTSLLIHDLFGGEIEKTRVSDAWHYYNRIGNERFDFTESQFNEAIRYDDLVSNRDEAFTDTDAEQLASLTARYLAAERGEMNCRSGCAACCIAPSISSPIPGMPEGKPAGVRCVQLTDDLRCAIFGQPERPAVCRSLRPQESMCGASRDEAMRILDQLEIATLPSRS